MLTIIKYLIVNFLYVFYQFTSFQVWGVDLAGLAQKARDLVIESSVIHLIEIILAPITVFLFAALVNISNRHRELREKLLSQHETVLVPESQPQAALAGRWQEIMTHIESIREGEWKFAVIEADQLVDDIIKNLFPGETMGERLMNIDKTKLLTIDGLWEAHKIRNRLAHDTNYFLRHAEAIHAIRLYEQSLKELGAL